MDIQKNESCKRLIAVLICLTCGLALGSDYDALNTLKKSYQISEGEGYQTVIDKLQDVYQTCDNKLLKERIQYRIGMLNFKSGDIQRAFGQFQQISSDSECSLGIQLAGMNMAVQIARMQGRDDNAKEHSDRLIQKILGMINNSSNEVSAPVLEKMYISSVFGKAEIYISQKQYVEAIAEYKKAIQGFSNGVFKSSPQYLPVLYDRLSQLYLKTDNVQGYRNYVSMIADECPDYERMASVKLESFAIQFLEARKVKQDYVNGSLKAPAQLILYAKGNTDSQDIPRIELFFNEMSDQANNGTDRWLIKYHYAWFLDAIGKKDASLELFNKIISGIETDAATKSDYIMQKILDYSKLQKALMDGESERYKEGLQCIDSIENNIKDAHISGLADSIRNSLETLKREVPKDENTKQ